MHMALPLLWAAAYKKLCPERRGRADAARPHMALYRVRFVCVIGVFAVHAHQFLVALFKERMKFAWEQVVETAKKVAPYVLIGVGIGAFIHNWIPEEFIVKALGENNPFGVILATIVGIPMYADIFGTIPIAEALLAKGALLGVVLSFMMGVTTLSLPSMIMLRKAVKPKLLGIFIGICAAGIIIVGYLFNAIQYLIV